MAATRTPPRVHRDQAPSGARRAGRPVCSSTPVLLLALALAGAAGVAYSTSFQGVFIFDDHFAIVANPNIRALWPLTRAMLAPPESPVSGRPIASLTLAINYALAPEDVRGVLSPGGPDAPPGTAEQFLRNVWGYHFLNLSLHALAALALFGVVRRTLLSERLRPRFGPDSTPLAFVVALVWLVHPVLTDAVTYVAQRTEVLMGLFYLLTFYCAIRAADRETIGAGAAWWAAGAVVACALGMGSKQTIVLAPLLVYLWGWMFARAPQAPRLRWGMYAGLAATWAILAGLVALERWPHTVGIRILGWTPWTYLLTQSGVIVHYLRLSLLPTMLVSDYAGWPMARSVVEVAPYAAALTVLFGAALFAVVRRNGWGFVGAWFFATLAPSSSLLPLPTEIAAERRMYLPLAGVVVVAVVGTYLVGQRLLPLLIAGERRRRLVGRLTAVLLAGGTGVTFATLTQERNRDYWSEERFWQDTVEKRPTNPRARLNYGVVLSAKRRYPEAEPQLQEAVRLDDTSAAAHGNLGSVLCSLGRLDEGVPHLERAIALDPEYTAAYRNLGEAYGTLGQLSLAAKYFGLAADAAPDTPFLLVRLGWLLATSPEDAVRNGARAVEVGERAVRLTSRQDAMALDALAAAYAEVGRFDDAAATAREALAVAFRQGNEAVRPELANRLSLYLARQKFRQTQ